MKRRSFAVTEEPSAEIDLTPMLDVVFIMLIFFIVTATFIKEPGIQVERPVLLTAEQVKNQKILVAIAADDEIWFDKRNIDGNQVRAAIEKALAENPKGAVVIQADKNSTAGKVAQVIDAAKQAGVTAISVAATR